MVVVKIYTEFLDICFPSCYAYIKKKKNQQKTDFTMPSGFGELVPSTKTISYMLNVINRHGRSILGTRKSLNIKRKSYFCLLKRKAFAYFHSSQMQMEENTSIYVGIMIQFPSFQSCSSPGLTTSFA